MSRIGVMFDCNRAPEELPEFAVALEAAGADDLWVVEDLGWNGGVSAAALALAATTRLRVGIGIAPAPFRSPAVYAMEIATLARVHPGRVVAGIGHGVGDWMRRIGNAPKSPLSLLEESIVAIRGLLDGETVSMDGREVHLEDIKLVHPPAVVPPIVTGVVRPKSLELSGRVADGTILVEGLQPAQIEEAIGHIRRGGAGDDHEIITFAFLHVEDDPDKAAAVRTTALTGQAGFLGVPVDEVFGLIGPASDVPAGVQILTGGGADTVVLRPFGDDHLGQALAALKALGR
ncbi:Flavin-dependent oxidoreductase, luciferase family (includes alkanesulfonate monooxygenase SsuD and methylene tetrahydromethanopterin reductase) [Actinoplanes philippinensis]|uniref:Flavin-dependent oxidoreductase, luciferase family (Includes alkanesulfonate monooxygenase SsuD and methylene tetrahydromethanopterin reductase) n=1 Tax=Actinoplanes philippinensis TaxID=35752 RepID=A0A1I2JV89_9ACTN|nr:LLM class flavin-dependent oxidoreductase [Actinoplanes philippinensis]SFF58735.1 Flavin-dependent oxidoreductase, luciferase family (includes alkanesulfonate monooxygenase SsuD and methylene tetrahydromethanopterin reductase) [Actinoplanes philippinensis]